MRKPCFEFDLVWLFVPPPPLFLPNASCQSDLLWRSTASQCCFISEKFPKLRWFPGTDLCLQVPQLHYELVPPAVSSIHLSGMTCQLRSELLGPDQLMKRVNPFCTQVAGAIYRGLDWTQGFLDNAPISVSFHLKTAPVTSTFGGQDQSWLPINPQKMIKIENEGYIVTVSESTERILLMQDKVLREQWPLSLKVLPKHLPSFVRTGNYFQGLVLKLKRIPLDVSSYKQ